MRDVGHGIRLRELDQIDAADDPGAAVRERRELGERLGVVVGHSAAPLTAGAGSYPFAPWQYEELEAAGRAYIPTEQL